MTSDHEHETLWVGDTALYAVINNDVDDGLFFAYGYADDYIRPLSISFSPGLLEETKMHYPLKAIFDIAWAGRQLRYVVCSIDTFNELKQHMNEWYDRWCSP